MNRAPITTLFGEVSTAGRGPSGFIVSAILHCGLFSLAFYTLRLSSPQVIESGLVAEEPVRVVTLDRPSLPRRQFGRLGAPNASEVKSAPHEGPAGGRKTATALPHMETRPIKALQTLVDPIVIPKILLEHRTPLPLVVLWTPEPVQVKNITPPPPQELAAANVKPVLSPPNHEPDLSDLQTTTAPPVNAKLTLPPSSTSPLTIDRPKAVQQVPETTSKPDAQPTPASVISISNIKLMDGKAVLPPANQVSAASTIDSLHAGRSVNGPTELNNNPSEKDKGNGSSDSPGDHGQLSGKGDNSMVATPSNSPGSGSYAPGHHSPVNGANGTSNAGMDPESNTDGEHIALPSDGRYGAVVVGTNLTDAFPESEGIMTDRLTYTVYLQVGLPRSWILQYSLPASAERGVNTIRPDAPWPYDIYRPRIKTADLNADAILVHGIINAAGHFEQLDIVYPKDMAEEKPMLKALNRWQFRPAMQKGLTTPVEILLIIPIS